MCGYKGCKTLTEVDPFNDIPQMGAYAVRWCDYHSKLYHKECDLLDEQLDKYNKMKIKNKFGRVIKFSHHSDLSNYLFKNDKVTLNKIVKNAELLIK